MKMNKKIMSVLLLTSMFALMFTGLPANATAKLEISNSTVFGDSTVALVVSDLSPSIAYAIAKDGTFVYNWTSGTAETSRVFYEKVDTTGFTTFTFYEATVLVATLEVNSVDTSTFIPIQLMLQIGIALLILYVVGRVIRNFVGGR